MQYSHIQSFYITAICQSQSGFNRSKTFWALPTCRSPFLSSMCQIQRVGKRRILKVLNKTGHEPRKFCRYAVKKKKCICLKYISYSITYIAYFISWYKAPFDPSYFSSTSPPEKKKTTSAKKKSTKKRHLQYLAMNEADLPATSSSVKGVLSHHGSNESIATAVGLLKCDKWQAIVTNMKVVEKTPPGKWL